MRTVFELDGRAYRTLYFLFTRPGFLAREYVSGRRASYTPPLRLFLVISIVFFLTVSAFTSLQSMRNVISEQDPALATDTDQSLQIEPEAAADAGMAQILEVVDSFSVPFISDAANANLRRYMASQAASNLNGFQADASGYFLGSLDYITVFILLMMPMLALVQKLLYLRSQRFYIEHLILTLHNHSFLLLAIFLALTIALFEDSAIIGSLLALLGTAINIWIVVYLFLSLRNFFEQGYAITITKFILMAIIYSIVTALGVFFFAIVLFFLF